LPRDLCVVAIITTAALISTEREAGRTYRGSSKRVRRIRWQDHTPPSLVAFMAAGLAMIVLLISWLVTHPQAVHHHTAEIIGDAIIGNSR
jgi:hypothetical protein